MLVSDLTPLQKAILLAIRDSFDFSKNHTFQLGDLALLVSGQIPKGVIFGALQSLKRVGLIEETSEFEGDVRTYAPPQSGPLYVLSETGAEFVYELASLNAASPKSAEPETWEPLPLDPESEQITEAIQKSEELLDRLRGDNGLATSEPRRYAGIVSSLKSGIDILRSLAPTKEQIQILLVKPMKYLAERFASTAVGELAKEASKAVLRLIGLGV